MSNYRKKPVVIEATQWFKMGDHPEVKMVPEFLANGGRGEPSPGIETLEGKLHVTPGDWIITGVKGEHYACKPDIFALTYEPTPPALPDEVGEIVRRLRGLSVDKRGYVIVLPGVIMEAASLIERLAPRWISVDERLPEIEVDVLTWDGKSVRADWIGTRSDFGRGVTHWQSFPLPPQKGSM